MVTQVIEYLPGYPVSNTRILLQSFLDALPPGEEVRRHDLLEQPAPIFTAESLRAYTKRDMLGEALDEGERASLVPFDALIADARAADVLVLAFPCHNFSVPAAIKAYFDAIMLNRATWLYGPNPGQYTGLMTATKALSISAAGGVYDTPPISTWNHLSPLVDVEFTFMGFGEREVIMAEGMLRPAEVKESSLARATDRVREVAGRWYKRPEQERVGQPSAVLVS